VPVLGLPSERPSRDGAWELPRRAAPVIEDAHVLGGGRLPAVVPVSLLF
jgi:hypothetical protein